MYSNYFGFKERPFKLLPDPTYLFLSKSHEEALAHLKYAVEHGDGFVEITGEVGTGKTTICRCLLEQIPSQAKVALVLNPKVNEIELLETICDELKISYPAGENNSLKIYTDRIYTFLIESNRKNEKTVLIIDEAQNLTRKQMTTLITRAGPGTKIVCIGNIAQIDTPYISETTSGLTYVVDGFKSWRHSGHITLLRGERSRLADFAAEELA